MTTLVKTETAPYLQAFRSRRLAGEPPWLSTLREGAIARFAEAGFPSRRDEDWRFTDMRPLQRSFFDPRGEMPPASAGVAVTSYSLGVESHRIVIANGRLSAELSRIGALPPGTFIGSIAEALARGIELRVDEGERDSRQPFAALNAAFFADGFAVIVPEGTTLDRPVEILHYGEAGEPVSLHMRNAILVHPRARATVVESFAGTGGYWTNSVTSVRVSEGAELRHLKLQDEGREAVHLALNRVSIADAARYDSFVMSLGAALSRHDTLAAIEGQHASCGVSGAFLLRGAQECTNATLVDHAAPCSRTREMFKGVVEERAHGVFQGKIRVRREAQKSDAHQLSRNLLLSPRAAIDAKPELEIFADDVKCSHGATVGDLDEASLFYLRARGIDETAARRLLIEAFAAEAVDLVEDEAGKAYLRRHLDRWLGRDG